LRQADPELRELGVRVVVVTFESAAAVTSYREETGITYPVLIDESRGLYHAYGLGRAKLRHLIGPTTLKAYASEAFRGQLPKRPVADTTQQGGNVLVDPGGIVRFHHVGAGSGYRPPISDILDARRRTT
jgi:hypothetical protein